ncbi:proline/glycine betaine ABC transporter permease [Chitinispirillales bacterium ANBcel5]|uniref:ABC transporter permease n=1 Tax=Cellulosispirillum alkaliphilum TaxID=3039283 RepID=UPI002A4F7518|nr:proline/glycine betaine ABC transporter permease [Chitinispirillales bacterium ANBcel5]
MSTSPLFRIPLAEWVDSLLDFLTATLAGATRSVSNFVQNAIDFVLDIILLVPPWAFIIVVVLLLLWRTGIKLATFSLVGLFILWNLNLWVPTMTTIALVLVSTVFAIAMGLPLGVIAALHKKAGAIITPILDFMQTMPAFVYLIPAIPFFGLGTVSAVFATVIFSIPPTIRLTALGINQVSLELEEAADAFGATTAQKLFKVQLPLATATIMAGINQTIMLGLSMAVIASMIGAGGLGAEVWRAIQRLQPGLGFEAGLGVVIVAMILDRITQKIGTKKSPPRKLH